MFPFCAESTSWSGCRLQSACLLLLLLHTISPLSRFVNSYRIALFLSEDSKKYKDINGESGVELIK